MSHLSQPHSFAGIVVVILLALVAGCNDLPMDPFCADPAPLHGSPADGWTESFDNYGVGFVRWTTPEEGKEIAEELADALDFEIIRISRVKASFSADMTPLQRDLVRCDRRVRYVEYNYVDPDGTFP